MNICTDIEVILYSSRSEMLLRGEFEIPSKREILMGLPHARQEWNRKNKMHKWFYFYGLGKMPFDLTLTPMFREDTKTVYWFTYFYFVYQTFYFLLVLYTFYRHLASGDTYSCLPCICMAGLFIAVCMPSLI